jgi:hypothetical protein
MTDVYIYLNLLLGNNVLGLSGGAAGQGDALLGETHLLGECAVWDPFCGCPGGGLLQHLVDLLKGEALGLGDEKVCEGEGDTAESTPEEEDLWAQVGIAGVGADKVWGDDSDDLLFYVSKKSLIASNTDIEGSLRSSRTN